jgi:hypothetical protein
MDKDHCTSTVTFVQTTYQKIVVQASPVAHTLVESKRHSLDDSGCTRRRFVGEFVRSFHIMMGISMSILIHSLVHFFLALPTVNVLCHNRCPHEAVSW